jgi:UDPglucose 6-dehydrogenase
LPRKVRPAERRPAAGVVGLGYMGLATAAAFARHGVTTFGFDVLPQRRAAVRAGSSPFHEEGLEQLLRTETSRGRLRVVDTLAELVERSTVIFLCVPTPPKDDGRIDLRPLEAVVRQLGGVLRATNGFRLVVVKSTVVPGTTESFVAPLLREVSGRGPRLLGVAANPEFLAEGRMVRDALQPDRIVVGVSDARSARTFEALFRGFGAPVLTMSPAGAEMTKYAANTFLALKVSFANELSRFSEQLGVDVDDVVRGFGSDRRIGESFLQAGPGFGGSCFSKDVQAFTRTARDHGVELRIAEQILPVNDAQTRHAVELVVRALPNGGNHGVVALLGLAFKEGTDDLRESRALPIARELARRGLRVRAHDPVARGKFAAWLASEPAAVRQRVDVVETVEEAVQGADVAVVQVPWPEYLAWPPEWTSAMRRPALVDLRRRFPLDRALSQKLTVVRLGDGRTVSAPACVPSRRERQVRAPPAIDRRGVTA